MKALMPWTGIGALRTEMDRLFDRFWEAELPAWPALGDWMPKVDVADTKQAFVVKADLPGIDPKDVESFEEEITKEVEGYTGGVRFESRSGTGIQQLDNFGDGHVLTLVRLGGGRLNLAPMSVRRF